MLGGSYLILRSPHVERQSWLFVSRFVVCNESAVHRSLFTLPLGVIVIT